jgi:hypothetical protein
MANRTGSGGRRDGRVKLSDDLKSAGLPLDRLPALEHHQPIPGAVPCKKGVLSVRVTTKRPQYLELVAG